MNEEKRETSAERLAAATDAVLQRNSEVAESRDGCTADKRAKMLVQLTGMQIYATLQLVRAIDGLRNAVASK